MPFLGICLGMQALFETSEEAPEVAASASIPGAVQRFPADARVPHMGWNELEVAARVATDALRAAPYVYFAHSYYVPGVPDRPSAICTYAVRVHRGARSRQRLRRAVPPREVGRRSGLRDRAGSSWSCSC